MGRASRDGGEHDNFSAAELLRLGVTRLGGIGKTELVKEEKNGMWKTAESLVFSTNCEFSVCFHSTWNHFCHSPDCIKMHKTSSTRWRVAKKEREGRKGGRKTE